MIDLEAALFEHAGAQRERLKRLRGSLNVIEQKILDRIANPPDGKELTLNQLKGFYQMISKSITSITDLLIVMHQSVADEAKFKRLVALFTAFYEERALEERKSQESGGNLGYLDAQTEAEYLQDILQTGQQTGEGEEV